jgi:hypothetical protein
MKDTTMLVAIRHTVDDQVIGNSGLTRWLRQVEELLPDYGLREDWYVLGSACIIEHTTEQETHELAQRVAARLSLPLIDWQGEASDIQGPAILYVNRDYWGRSSPNQVLNENYEMVSPELIQALDDLHENFDPIRPILAILSAADFTHVPESLRCIGKFDRRFDCRNLSFEQLGTNFLSWVGWDLCEKTLKSKAKQVGRLLSAEDIEHRRQGLIVAALRRRVRDDMRLLTFTDILHFVLHGTAEFDVANDSEKALHRCAVHEAGHAAIALVDSAGEDIPDYAAIGTSHDFAGVTTHSYGYRMDDDLDHSKVLHKVRNCLGGRAAEELVFGVLGIGTRGNSDDLRIVSDLVLEMYLECGMASDFSDPNTSTDHLLVATGQPSEHQLLRAENAARAFIAEQYRAVMQMLANNRSLLDAITDELLSKRLLEAEDFARLWQLQRALAEPTNLR